MQNNDFCYFSKSQNFIYAKITVPLNYLAYPDDVMALQASDVDWKHTYKWFFKKGQLKLLPGATSLKNQKEISEGVKGDYLTSTRLVHPLNFQLPEGAMFTCSTIIHKYKHHDNIQLMPFRMRWIQRKAKDLQKMMAEAGQKVSLSTGKTSPPPTLAQRSLYEEAALHQKQGWSGFGEHDTLFSHMDWPPLFWIS
ncbi:hypothetical protein AMECASPLE_034754 [Ameca splendens]|uniref:Uncharacterized protein n=1 Tax=Ameca splendens TaxID=208324 RepID=A0ABV0Z566_9TELE